MSLPSRRPTRANASLAPDMSIHVTPITAPRAPRTTATILLVDDDPAVLEALRRVFELEGWSVIAASSGREALQYLQTHKPDLMITDLSMTEVSGWDLLFYENLQRPDLPIFVITGLPVKAAGGADRFANEFFAKPLDLDQVVARVRQYLSAQ